MVSPGLQLNIITIHITILNVNVQILLAWRILKWHGGHLIGCSSGGWNVDEGIRQDSHNVSHKFTAPEQMHLSLLEAEWSFLKCWRVIPHLWVFISMKTFQSSKNDLSQVSNLNIDSVIRPLYIIVSDIFTNLWQLTVLTNDKKHPRCWQNDLSNSRSDIVNVAKRNFQPTPIPPT